ncbi:MAG TPA: PQQ-binding-like beta-propeller repeat protein [Gemmataceae bacterium]|nr:PQQ-binding-like beta-propeller repeat protein [Gemmataceae bacterium]
MKTKMQLFGSVLLLGILTTALVPLLDARAPVPKSTRLDWPQWRGPNHDNVSTETGLLKSWPESGPKLLWTATEAGLGYSGPAIVGDRLYTLGSDQSNDFVVAFDTQNGKKLWSTTIGTFVQNGWGGGPRSTPSVDGDHVYALSSSGQLACLTSDKGKRVWSESLTKNLGGGKPNWNYSESPLVDGNQVICTPGGSRGTMAALDKRTGRVLWRSKQLTDPAGYSSAVPFTVGGVRQYAQLTMKGVAGVAAKDGRLLWYYPNKKYRTAVIPSPIVYENSVYAVAGYGAGAVLLNLTPSGKGIKAEQLYDEDAMRLMNNKHEGVVRVGDYVYGWSDNGGWTCQEWKTGKKMWQSRKLGRGAITCADGMLYCYSEDKGTCVLVPASSDGWEEKGRFTIPQHSEQRSRRGGVWTHPVVANGKLYLRDQELIFCYEVK